MSRPKLSAIEKAVNAVLDLTPEQRESFAMNLRILEAHLHGPKQLTAPRRKATQKPKPAPEAVNG